MAKNNVFRPKNYPKWPKNGPIYPQKVFFLKKKSVIVFHFLIPHLVQKFKQPNKEHHSNNKHQKRIKKKECNKSNYDSNVCMTCVVEGNYRINDYT